MNPGPSDLTDDSNLVDEIHEIRRQARSDRRAFWFPLLIFGLMITASAPMYAGSSADGRNLDLGFVSEILGGHGTYGNPAWLTVYWISLLVGGSVMTAAWYVWYSRVAGLATRVRPTALTWLGGTAAVIVLPLAPLSLLYLNFPLWQLTARGTAGLLIAVAGFWVLAYLERSRLLAVVTAVFTVAAALGVLYDTSNLLYDFLSSTDSLPENLPYWLGAATNVILPGSVLLVGAVVAFIKDLRGR